MALDNINHNYGQRIVASDTELSTSFFRIHLRHKYPNKHGQRK